MTSANGHEIDEHLRRASEVAAKLKPGSYESVRSLAFLSIATSLSRIASALENR